MASFNALPKRSKQLYSLVMGPKEAQALRSALGKVHGNGSKTQKNVQNIRDALSDKGFDYVKGQFSGKLIAA